MGDMDLSKHLPYELSELKKIEHAIREEAIIKLADIALRGVAHPKIMDIGCGRGELMSRLKDKFNAQVYGIDVDPVCIQFGKAYGDTVQADMSEPNEQLNREYHNYFDLVICSHVLEHLKRPYESIETICNMSKEYIILAVPNPHSMLNILNIMLLRRFQEVNKGHYYSWDGPHFAHFLKGHTGLEIVKWGSDRVTFIPWKKMRSFMAKIHLLKLLDGKILPKIFPFCSESLIALCRKVN